MRMPRFALEDWVAQYRSACAYSIGSSDVDPLTLDELLSGADSEILGLWSKLTLSYGHSRGAAALRDEIAERYQGIDAERVHTFSGATEAIFALLNVLVATGDEVVVVGPSYQLVSDLPVAIGAQVRRVDLRADREWALDLDELRRAVTARTRVVVLNFPNNPTGTSLSRDEFDEVLAIAREADAWLVNDEIYQGVEDDADRLPAAAELGERCVSIGSMSKVYGLPGVRLGWVAAPDARLMDELRTYRYWTSLSNNVVGEVLALAGLRQSARLIDRAKTLLSANKAALEQFAAGHPGLVRFTSAKAGTTTLLELRNHEATAVARRLAQRHSVFAVPGAALHLPDRYLRFGLGRAAVPVALEALDSVLKES
ncbi:MULTISPECIES: aminotransferase class I/II-fold pyridoxal phosphate-dependent enzyme [Amycolatopsis]|uniref:aminotransferase class I/II-fold pyridoxal phosphate-dependent enzyme n=1 Tax=Amycolatopsis TaxID=1813 RepID=UPI00142FB602|nr:MULTISPECIES: aminotransferase class I/II-fold pyridoxal phosphate-dependent enzyme [Amycolatopsis]